MGDMNVRIVTRVAAPVTFGHRALPKPIFLGINAGAVTYGDEVKRDESGGCLESMIRMSLTFDSLEKAHTIFKLSGTIRRPMLPDRSRELCSKTPQCS
jgi:hypothetical protein